MSSILSRDITRIHHYEFSFQAFWKPSKNRLFIFDGTACLNRTVIMIIIHIYCIFLKDTWKTYFTCHYSVPQCSFINFNLKPLLVIMQVLNISVKWEIFFKLHLLKNYFSMSLRALHFITWFFSISTVIAFHKSLKLGGILVGTAFSHQPQRSWQTTY